MPRDCILNVHSKQTKKDNRENAMPKELILNCKFQAKEKCPIWFLENAHANAEYQMRCDLKKVVHTPALTHVLKSSEHLSKSPESWFVY